jgi:hypothetical protein
MQRSRNASGVNQPGGNATRISCDSPLARPQIGWLRDIVAGMTVKRSDLGASAHRH